MDLQVGPAFFCIFSPSFFAARLRAAESLSDEAGVEQVLQDDFEFELEPAGCDSRFLIEIAFYPIMRSFYTFQ
jgi:hypothetical protein